MVKAGVRPGLWIWPVRWSLKVLTVPPHGGRLLGRIIWYTCTWIVDGNRNELYHWQNSFSFPVPNKHFYNGPLNPEVPHLSCTIFENNIIIPSSFDTGILFLVILQKWIATEIFKNKKIKFEKNKKLPQNIFSSNPFLFFLFLYFFNFSFFFSFCFYLKYSFRLLLF